VGNEGRHRVEIDEASQSGPAHARYIIENASPPVDGDVASLPNRLDTVFAQLQLRKSGLAHPSNWPEAIRTLELLEGVEKSLAKGRTISVGVEGRSETDAFKGTMASLGCSLLILGLVIMVAGEAAAKVAEKAGMPLLRNVFRWWPALLLILFLVFLVLQLFRYVIPKPPK
jgi:hypothetical protein